MQSQHTPVHTTFQDVVYPSCTNLPHIHPIATVNLTHLLTVNLTCSLTLPCPQQLNTSFNIFYHLHYPQLSHTTLYKPLLLSPTAFPFSHSTNPTHLISQLRLSICDLSISASSVSCCLSDLSWWMYSAPFCNITALLICGAEKSGE